MTNHPRKRDGLEIHVVEDQCVVFEPDTDRIHYLNPTAALVLELCDGDRSPADIVALVQDAYGLDTAPSDEVISCLRNLAEAGVVG